MTRGSKPINNTYDIIVFGAGIAGLFTASRLVRAGYNVLVFEKDRLGGTQTLASQGMIHGGQKYALQGRVTATAAASAAMPEKWEACFGGWGDVDLSGVKFLSDTQVMFPAGGALFSSMTVFAAARAVNAATRKMKKEWYPEPVKQGPVYELQERVLETKTMMEALAKNLKGRLFRGEPQELLPDGQVVVAGQKLKAQVILCLAGTGNETALKLLKVREQQTQRRPLRQIMVKSLPHALYGHGMAGRPKPRVTVTSHPDGTGGYIWYLGGNVAEEGANRTEEEALRFAQKEMKEIFPGMDWDGKEWASWQGDRAEPYDAAGQLPSGPVIQQRGQVLIAWPVKMTFVPALADNLFRWLKESAIAPVHTTPPPELPGVEMGRYPWEEATWRRL